MKRKKVRTYPVDSGEIVKPTLCALRVHAMEWVVQHITCDVMKQNESELVHIQIPPTSYVGLVLGSASVATESRSTVEGIMRVPCSFWMHSSSCHSSIKVPS